ncbi:MAG: hypothetical protein ACR2MP_02235 [Streptosporangiaceae bacterium]
MNPDRLDLGPQGTPARQAGEEGQARAARAGLIAGVTRPVTAAQDLTWPSRRPARPPPSRLAGALHRAHVPVAIVAG